MWKLTADPATGFIAEESSLDGHTAPVWRVEWNVAGSVLSSSGDDGRVMLWKQDLSVRGWV